MTENQTTELHDVTIRTATPADGAAIGHLFIESPDEGAVSFAPRFNFDPYEAYASLRPNSAGFVAETLEGRLAGVGFVSLTEARFGGDIRPTALLNALAVHPDFRGRGLAKAIVRHRIEYAREQLGDDCVAVANIQHGNDPSMAVARSWSDSLDDEYVMYPAEPLAGQDVLGEGASDTNASDNFDVHDVTAGEVTNTVDRSNEFYARTDLYRPYSVEGLEQRLETSPIAGPLHRYVVATVDDSVVAGVFVTETHEAMKLVLESLPPALQDAETLPSAIPESKELRMKMLSDLWYAPGHEDAARVLWRTLRANSGSANRIMLNYDPTGRLEEVLELQPGEGAMHLSVAVSGGSLSTDELAPVF